MPPRWVWFAVFGPLALCLTCSAIGYFAVWPRLQDTLNDRASDQIARNVQQSVSNRISTTRLPTSEILLYESDINVNNGFGYGSSGFESGTSGTTVYGFEIEITPDGIAMIDATGEFYSGMVVVENNRIEVTDVEGGTPILDLFLTEEGFADSMESGINAALADHGFTPTGVTLTNGTLTVSVAPRN